MNSRDQLASYLKKLQRRLRLGALLRGVAALVAVALTATLVLVLITNAFGFSDRASSRPRRAGLRSRRRRRLRFGSALARSQRPAGGPQG